ncbi:MAG: DM13 domain-containing protein, partial [Acidimicrobiia bacterium]|nr:DM13 domain-containing protein [Acidimicrobiia bacterium]
TSISEQLGGANETPSTTVPKEDADGGVPESDPTTVATTPPTDSRSDTTEPDEEPAGPVLLGAGQFVGLAGHEGTGDAGIFENPDGSLVLRFENFDIENGPDLEVYLVPGAGQTSLAEGSIHLGELKGNVGDQNYDLPPGIELEPGSYTVLVWCEAFSVEFVGATIDL